MEIIIGNKINPVTYKNVYKFDIEFMYGDADGYTNEVVFVRDENPNLKKFVKFLQNCQKAYPNGRRGDDNYNDVVEDWELFCSDGSWPKKDKNNIIQFFWPYDPGGDIQASFESFKITYFNDICVEHEVEIK